MVLNELVCQINYSHRLVVGLDRSRAGNADYSVRVLLFAVHVATIARLVNGGADVDLLPVHPLHKEQGPFTQPAHFPSWCVSGEGILSVFRTAQSSLSVLSVCTTGTILFLQQGLDACGKRRASRNGCRLLPKKPVY